MAELNHKKALFRQSKTVPPTASVDLLILASSWFTPWYTSHSHPQLIELLLSSGFLIRKIDI